MGSPRRLEKALMVFAVAKVPLYLFGVGPKTYLVWSCDNQPLQIVIELA